MQAYICVKGLLSPCLEPSVRAALCWAELLKILQLLQNVLGHILGQQRGVVLDDQHSVRPKQVQNTLLCDSLWLDCCPAGSWALCKVLHGVLDLQQQTRCMVS